MTTKFENKRISLGLLDALMLHVEAVIIVNEQGEDSPEWNEGQELSDAITMMEGTLAAFRNDALVDFFTTPTRGN